MRFLAGLAAVEAFLVYEAGKLANGEAVDEGNGELAHEGVEFRFHKGAFHLEAAKRVGAVKDQHLYAGLGAGAHHQAKRGNECVAAGSNVLDVIDHYVYPLEHLLRGLTGGAVQGIHRKAGCGVRAAFNFVAGVGVPTDAVLRAEEGHQVHLRGLVQDVNGGTEVPVHAAGVGYKANALSNQFLEAVALKDLDAGHDGFTGGLLGGGLRVCAGGNRKRCQYDYQSFHTSAIILCRLSGSPEK